MIDPLWLLLLGIVVVVGGILWLKLHPFLALILGALIVGALTPDAALETYAKSKEMSAEEAQSLVDRPLGARVTGEFGRTCGKIGILIAMASILGKCLLDSGAAERVIRSSLNRFGDKHAPKAFLGSGFLLSIPVFFDTVFYLMIPLGKALGVRHRSQYGLYLMTIIAGATMAHSLVPPTPGPLFVAGELHVGMGKMIIGGTVIGLIAVVFGYGYAVWVNRKWPVPLRDAADISVDDLENLSRKEDCDLPGLGVSLLPILLPIFLITGKTLFTALKPAMVSPFLTTAIDNLGNPNIALTLAALIALFMLGRQQRMAGKRVTEPVQQALMSGGVIILITSAGGAFGGILQQTGIGSRIQDLATTYQIAILPLAFFVTALIRTAQGSATVAMITAIGILGGLADAGHLDFHPLYLALAIGCGSKPFPWMNDSGFWVICKMSGMTEAETLRTSSTMMSLMAVAGLVATMIFARLFPLI